MTIIYYLYDKFLSENCSYITKCSSHFLLNQSLNKIKIINKTQARHYQTVTLMLLSRYDFRRGKSRKSTFRYLRLVWVFWDGLRTDGCILHKHNKLTLGMYHECVCLSIIIIVLQKLPYISLPQFNKLNRKETDGQKSY